MHEYEEALKNYKDSLAITQKTLGQKHPDCGIILNRIGNIYQNMGQYEEALENYQ